MAKWGRAYQRKAKKLEMRLHTKKWLADRLGTQNVFGFYDGGGRKRMWFQFPQPHSLGTHGYFPTLEDFWRAFADKPQWAAGFYTADGQDETGMQGFKDTVAELAEKISTKQCVWFEVLPRDAVCFSVTRVSIPHLCKHAQLHATGAAHGCTS